MTNFDFRAKLKNICVKILSLQVIKDIPIFTQIVINLCINKVWKKKKDPPIIKLEGHATKIMCGTIFVEKYGNP